MNLYELKEYLNHYLKIDQFNDYCPNGVQVEVKPKISKIVFGVSASLQLIEKAAELKADCLIVHHGYFWKNEKSEISGIKAKRICALIKNNINLLAYHLPLDAHPKIGNNIQLAKLLGFKKPKVLENSLIWTASYQGSSSELIKLIDQKLARKPLAIETHCQPIKNIAFCTGAAQDFLEEIIEKNIKVEAYISGEIAERTPLIAREAKINYYACGHHATERYGIKALAKHLKAQFDCLDCQFIDIDNPA